MIPLPCKSVTTRLVVFAPPTFFNAKRSVTASPGSITSYNWYAAFHGQSRETQYHYRAILHHDLKAVGSTQLRLTRSKSSKLVTTVVMVLVLGLWSWLGVHVMIPLELMLALDGGLNSR